MIEDTITCEDILSEKVCATLKEAAKKLKVKVEMVDKIVREAVAKGITKAKEIIKLVRQKIIDMATNLKCEDVLRADWCDKIKEVAAAMKIKFETVMKVMKEIIAKGITKAKEIIEEIKKHFFPSGELDIDENAITCEEVLAEKICKSLYDAAKKLKVKAEIVDKIIREAIEKGITKADEIIKLVREKIVELATNFKCEDVLPESRCAKIKEVAAAMKIKYETVMKVMKEIVAKGITKAKEIIEEIKKHFFPSAALMIEDTITCEDILSEKICATLKEAAKKLKVKVEMVDKIVREAVAKIITCPSIFIKLVRQKIIDMAT